METYIDWRLSSVLSLFGIGLLVHLLPLVVLLEADPGLARHGGVHAIIHSRAGVILEHSLVSCSILHPCPLAPLLAQDPGQLLEGRAVEEDGNGDNLPVVHSTLVPHRGVYSTLEGPNRTELDFSRQLWPHFCRVETTQPDQL